MATYVLISLRKLRAFKSKFGLGVTIFTEVKIVTNFEGFPKLIAL